MIHPVTEFTARGKRVLLAVDWNVPLGAAGQIVENNKILRSLPTIERLRNQEAILIITTHLGRPGGTVVPSLRLEPIAEYVSHILQRPLFVATGHTKLSERVYVFPERGNSVHTAYFEFSQLKPGDIVLLENIRFHPGEIDNDPMFAKDLASLADVFVNDAFGMAHDTEASICLVPKHLPSYAGLLMSQELSALRRVIEKPEHPFVVMLGGAKASTKMPIVLNLLETADVFLLGGNIANTFLAAQGKQIGRSLFDETHIATARKLMAKAPKKFIIPEDVVVDNMSTKRHEARITSNSEVGPDEVILDIGPRAIKQFAVEIKKAKTIVWNGPVGKFEDRQYRHGTLALAELFAAQSKRRAFGVAGGGETVEALHQTAMADMVDYVSTGGGAMLAMLSGGVLPAVQALERK